MASNHEGAPYEPGSSGWVMQRAVFIMAPLLVLLNLLDALGTSTLVRRYGAEVEGNPLLEPLVSSGGFVPWKAGVAALVATGLILATFDQKSRIGVVYGITLAAVLLYSAVVTYVLGLVLFA